MSSKTDFFTDDRFILVGDTAGRKFPVFTKRFLEERGKTVYAVDLAGSEGYLASLDEVPADAQAVIVEVSKERTEQVVSAALAKGIKKVWIHQMTDTPEALAACTAAGATVETGGCSVMYNAPPGFSGHALHRGIWKLIGRY
jgi:hypothetical protein